MKKTFLILFLICAGSFASCKIGTAGNQTPASGSNLPTNSQNQTNRKPAPPKQPIPMKNDPATNTSQNRSPAGSMVQATDFVPLLLEDMRYATTNNFLRRKLYDSPKCFLLKVVAEHLKQAEDYLQTKKPGYRLKVWDCYRPLSVQKIMSESVPDKRYVADPDKAKHPKGLAVDITIADSFGRELEMPSEFDDFSAKGGVRGVMTKEVSENLRVLQQVMMSANFVSITSEWWHFEYIGPL